MTSKIEYPPTVHVGILVFKDFEPIDVWGPVEAFSISSQIGRSYYDPPPKPFEIKLISNETKSSGGDTPQPVYSHNGPAVAPNMFREDALDEGFDMLMIPGGGGTRDLLDPKKPQAVKALLDWVKAMDKKVSLMTSVCTGAAILAASGCLDGKPAATNHLAFEWVTSLGPRVLWNNVSRWVDAGKYVTSAGVSAGTDMAFHLVARLAGRAVAEQAARMAEYDWHRDPDTPIHYPQQAVVPTERKKDDKKKEDCKDHGD